MSKFRNSIRRSILLVERAQINIFNTFYKCVFIHARPHYCLYLCTRWSEIVKIYCKALYTFSDLKMRNPYVWLYEMYNVTSFSYIYISAVLPFEVNTWYYRFICIECKSCYFICNILLQVISREYCFILNSLKFLLYFIT